MPAAPLASTSSEGEGLHVLNRRLGLLFVDDLHVHDVADEVLRDSSL